MVRCSMMAGYRERLLGATEGKYAQPWSLTEGKYAQPDLRKLVACVKLSDSR